MRVRTGFINLDSYLKPSSSRLEIFTTSTENEGLVKKKFYKTSSFRFCLFTLLYSFSTLYLIYKIISQSSIIPSEIFTLRGDLPANRAVVFISDGTKAESLYGFNSSGEPVAPFLKSVIHTNGSYGISYASLPTETRSCMTVLLSGHYLEFHETLELYFAKKSVSDHFLNESRWGWSFGSPEVITLFQSSKNPDNIDIIPYSNLNSSHKYAESERVFEQLNELFDKAKDNETLYQKLHQKNNIILVHLVGVDSSGHTKGSEDPDYLDQITFIDQGIKKAMEKIENFYQDKNTSYIITADHGMKTTLRHTGNNESNIKIPFIAWGAGIMGPESTTSDSKDGDFDSKSQNLEGIIRKDVRQMDLASLVSSLVGIPIPINSNGKIPVNYLASEAIRAEASLLNMKQLCSQYKNREKAWHKESYIAEFYDVESLKILGAVPIIEENIKNGQYLLALAGSNYCIDECIAGINTMKNTEKRGFIVTAVFNCLSWLGYCYMVSSRNGKNQNRSTIFSSIWAIISVSLLIYLALRNSPIYVYVFMIMPLIFSYRFFDSLEEMIFLTRNKLPQFVWNAIFIGFLYILAQTFQDKRNLLSILFLGWTIIASIEFLPNKQQLVTWVLVALIISYFMQFDPIELPDYPLFGIGWLSLIIINILGLKYFREVDRKYFKGLIVVFGFTVLSGIFVGITDYLIKHPYENFIEYLNVLNFLSIPLAFFFPLVIKIFYKPRDILQYYIIFVAMAPFSLISSLSFEAIFYCLFGIYIYLFAEFGIQNQNKTSLRRKMIFLIGFQILYQVSYFGFGNPGTFDMFSLDIGFRFVQKFDPVVLGSFQLLKFCVPYILLTLMFQNVVKSIFIGRSQLIIQLIALSWAGSQILFMIWPKELDYKHPILAWSYPLLSTSLFILNIAVSFLGHFYIKNE